MQNMRGSKVKLQEENYNQFYSSYIYVGNPPQKLMALFDTGSANTWILSDKVDLPENTLKMHHVFNEHKSKSFKNITPNGAKPMTIHFGSGQLQGHFVQDDIRIGLKDENAPDGDNSIKIKDFKFGLIEKQKSIFDFFQFDAIVGMAQQGLAKKGFVPILDAMMQQNLLKDNIFAYYMTNQNDE